MIREIPVGMATLHTARAQTSAEAPVGLRDRVAAGDLPAKRRAVILVDRLLNRRGLFNLRGILNYRRAVRTNSARALRGHRPKRSRGGWNLGSR